MRLPTLFLACLLLVAAYSAVSAARLQLQLRQLPPALAETHPEAAFAARLDAVSDPAELRRLALARHHALLDADHTSQTLFATVEKLSRSDLIESSLVLLLAGGVYLFDRRAPRPANPDLLHT